MPPTPFLVDSVPGNNIRVPELTFTDIQVAHAYYFNPISACTGLNPAALMRFIGIDAFPILMNDVPKGFDASSLDCNNGTVATNEVDGKIK